MSSDSSSDNDTIWNPQLRKIMGFLSVIGMTETAYLSFIKWTQSEPIFCSLQGSCGDVLNGPYASVGDIPLSAFGFVALSISLSVLVWFGGAVDDSKTTTSNTQKNTDSSWPIAQSGISSAVLTTLASLAFYASIDNVSPSSASATVDPNMPPGGYPPPTIMTKSTSESLALAKQLNSYNAKMYGAFWCSHCYDQKQNLGKEAMAIIPYIECAKDGKNSQTDLCKEKDVPGYPTWIINEKQYPGEQSIEELEEIVKGISGQK